MDFMKRNPLEIGSLVKFDDSCEYRIKKIIGYGSTSIVYEIENADGKVEALKEIFPGEICYRDDNYTILPINTEYEKVYIDLVNNCEAIETQFINKYNDPSVLKNEYKNHIYINGNRINNSYIKMNLLSGITLYEYFEKMDKDNINLLFEKNTDSSYMLSVVRIMIDFLDVLKDIHEKGKFILSDIKPDNLFLYGDLERIIKRKRPFPFYIDYGSCIALAEEQGKNSPYPRTAPISGNRYIGTKGYSPWERWHINNEQPFTLSTSSDLYSIARVFLFMITGDNFSRKGYDVITHENIYCDILTNTDDCNDTECINIAITTAKNKRKLMQYSEYAFEIVEKIIRGFLSNNENKRESIDVFINYLEELERRLDHNYYLSQVLPQRFNNNRFIGRQDELERLNKMIAENDVVFVSGIGGIGKTELVSQYAATFEGLVIYGFYETYYDDTNTNIGLKNYIMNIPISEKNIRSLALDEDKNTYQNRYNILKNLSRKDVLFIVDNYNTEDDSYLKDLISLGYKIVFTTKNDYEKYGYAQLNLTELSEDDCVEIYRNGCENIENDICKLIVRKLKYHTESIVLISAQQKYEHLSGLEMLNRLEKGLNSIGTSKIAYRKNGILYNDNNAYALIRKIFDMSDFSKEEIHLLRCVSLFGDAGVEIKKILELCNIDNMNIINKMGELRWLSKNSDRAYIKPIIKETIFDLEDVKLKVFEDSIMKLFDCNQKHIKFDDYSSANTILEKIEILKQLDNEIDNQLIVGKVIDYIKNVIYKELDFDTIGEKEEWIEGKIEILLFARKITTYLMLDCLDYSIIKAMAESLYEVIYDFLYRFYEYSFVNYPEIKETDKLKYLWLEIHTLIDENTLWSKYGQTVDKDYFSYIISSIRLMSNCVGKVEKKDNYMDLVEKDREMFYGYLVYKSYAFIEPSELYFYSQNEFEIVARAIIFNKYFSLSEDEIVEFVDDTLQAKFDVVKQMMENIGNDTELYTLYLICMASNVYEDKKQMVDKIEVLAEDLINKYDIYFEENDFGNSLRLIGEIIYSKYYKQSYKDQLTRLNKMLTHIFNVAIEKGDKEAYFDLFELSYRKNNEDISDSMLGMLKKSAEQGSEIGVRLYVNLSSLFRHYLNEKKISIEFFEQITMYRTELIWWNMINYKMSNSVDSFLDVIVKLKKGYEDTELFYGYYINRGGVADDYWLEGTNYNEIQNELNFYKEIYNKWKKMYENITREDEPSMELAKCYKSNLNDIHMYYKILEEIMENNVEAMQKIAEDYYKGNYHEQNISKAIELFTKIDTLKSPDVHAELRLGEIYSNPEYNNVDFKKAVFYYKKVLKLYKYHKEYFIIDDLVRVREFLPTDIIMYIKNYEKYEESNYNYVIQLLEEYKYIYEIKYIYSRALFEGELLSKEFRINHDEAFELVKDLDDELDFKWHDIEDLYYLKAQLYEERKDYCKAYAYYRKSKEKYPKDLKLILKHITKDEIEKVLANDVTLAYIYEQSKDNRVSKEEILQVYNKYGKAFFDSYDVTEKCRWYCSALKDVEEISAEDGEHACIRIVKYLNGKAEKPSEECYKILDLYRKRSTQSLEYKFNWLILKGKTSSNQYIYNAIYCNCDKVLNYNETTKTYELIYQSIEDLNYYNNALEEIALAGNYNAMLHLSWYKDIKLDSTMAFDFCKEVYDNDFEYAGGRLAEFYETGYGTTKDISKANEIYKKFALKEYLDMDIVEYYKTLS